MNENIPILDIGNREGLTDYIDFIHPSEVTSRIMKGFDKQGRFFIVMKCKGESEINHIDINFMQTFFQRYPDKNDFYYYHGCGNYCIPFLETSGGMNQPQIHFLMDLYNGKKFDSFDLQKDTNSPHYIKNCSVRFIYRELVNFRLEYWESKSKQEDRSEVE